jgi:UDP-N-acetyl-D-mannosaminuronic acid dehydrogenase
MSQLCESALQEAGRRVYGAKVTVFGLAYLENSDDTRNSPAFTLLKALEVVGALPVVHDPFVKESNGIRPIDDIKKALTDSDCLVLVTAHDEYSKLDLGEIKNLMRTPIIIDGRNVFDKDECISKGFIYRGVGQ